MSPAALTGTDTTHVDWVRADSSGMAVGLCDVAMDSPIAIRTPDGSTWKPIGGAVSPTESQLLSIKVFPSPAKGPVDLVSGDTVLASLAAPSYGPTSCETTADSSPSLKVLACGALLTLQWDTAVPISAAKIGLVDVWVTDSETGDRASFYLISTQDGPSGTSVVFSTDRTNRGIDLALAGIELASGEQPAIPGTTAFFELAP